MANHAYIPLEKKITIEKLKNIIAEIVNRRFKGYFGTNLDDEHIWINIKKPKCDWFKNDEALALIWINEKGNIEFRHGHGDEGWWVDLVLEKELCKHFGIKRMYDDGIGWYNIDFKNMYPTFRDSRIGLYENRRKKNEKLPFMLQRQLDARIKDAVEISDAFGDDLNKETFK
jgi:hypothetical protein